MTTVLRCRAQTALVERLDYPEATDRYDDKWTFWLDYGNDGTVRCEMAAGHPGAHSAFLNQPSAQAWTATRDENLPDELHAFWEDGREPVTKMVFGCDAGQFFYDNYPNWHDSWFPGCRLPKDHFGPHSDSFSWWQERELDDIPDHRSADPASR